MFQLQPLNFRFENNTFTSNFSYPSKFVIRMVDRLDSLLGAAPFPRFAKLFLKVLSLVAVEQRMILSNWRLNRLRVPFPSSEFRRGLAVPLLLCLGHFNFNQTFLRNNLSRCHSTINSDFCLSFVTYYYIFYISSCA